VPRGITGATLSLGDIYLTLQAGGVSDETVKYVKGFARLGPLSDRTANCRPILSSERAPHSDNTTFRQEVILLSCLDNRLTDSV
jgi:hypothetical protein